MNVKLKTRYLLIYILLCCPYLIKGQVKHHLADSLFNTQQYGQAAIEYERIIYEMSNDSTQWYAIFKKITCYKKLKRYTDAKLLIEKYIAQTIPDSFKFDAYMQAIVCSFLDNQLEDSKFYTQLLEQQCPDSVSNKNFIITKIFVLNELHEWENARICYERISLRTDNQTLTHTPYAHIPKLKDPEKAKILATWLPLTPIGLFYGGNYGEGILNTVLQWGFIGYGLYEVLLGNYISAALVGIGGYSMLYQGSIIRAQTLAENYNKKISYKFNKQINETLLKWTSQ